MATFYFNDVDIYDRFQLINAATKRIIYDSDNNTPTYVNTEDGKTYFQPTDKVYPNGKHPNGHTVNGYNKNWGNVPIPPAEPTGTPITQVIVRVISIETKNPPFNVPVISKGSVGARTGSKWGFDVITPPPPPPPPPTSESHINPRMMSNPR